MALPKTFDYDPEHDEPLVMSPTEGVTGFSIHFIGLDINRKIIQIVASEGVLAADGKSLETQTKENQELRLTEQEVTDFYAANSAAIDSLIAASMERWAESQGKTGVVNT